jgi:mannose-6-phosphate isomerase-like protein (cupin superfamily)
MAEKIDLAAEHAALPGPWRPATVAAVNDHEVKVVKLEGEFHWHKHTSEDELFLVTKGRLTMQLRDGDVEVGPGELIIVPKGVEHCPRADEETHVVLFEPSTTVRTGD